MDIITMARDLGKALQQEETYKKLHEVQTKADADKELQTLIGEFNLKRMAINGESSKKDSSQEKLSKLNAEMREVYSKIMSNENMIAYNAAKADYDAVANRVLAIVQQSSEGADPETADYSSCSGSCDSCGGCH